MLDVFFCIVWVVVAQISAFRFRSDPPEHTFCYMVQCSRTDCLVIETTWAAEALEAGREVLRERFREGNVSLTQLFWTEPSSNEREGPPSVTLAGSFILHT